MSHNSIESVGEQETHTTPLTLEKKIKKWVELDNNIKTANEEIKDVRTERSIINDEIIAIIEQQQLNKATVKNAFGLGSELGSATRISKHMENVIPNGNKELVGWFDVEATNDYTDAIKSNPVFTDLKNNNQTIINW